MIVPPERVHSWNGICSMPSSGLFSSLKFWGVVIAGPQPCLTSASCKGCSTIYERFEVLELRTTRLLNVISTPVLL
jgi:hypothetical protein